MDKINRLIAELKSIELELENEIQQVSKNYYYTVIKNKIQFEAQTLKLHRKLGKGLLNFMFGVGPLYYLAAPIIYSLFIPAFILDLCVSFYQFSCFPIFKIPKVSRKQYIIIDQQYLGYLNIIEKLNCVYCSYFNGLVAWIQEIAGRTEQHFCPIKHAKKLVTMHSRYNKFIDFGAAEEYKNKSKIVKNDFGDLL